MKLSIIEAGKFTKVHRATLHRWLKKDYLQKDKGLVETDDIFALKKGRKAGKAYKNEEPCIPAQCSDSLVRALAMIGGVLNALPEDHRQWVKKAVGQYLEKPELLMEQSNNSEETNSQEDVDTSQNDEALWESVISEPSLTPKLSVQSPALKMLGDELKTLQFEEGRAKGTSLPPGVVRPMASRSPNKILLSSLGLMSLRRPQAL